MTSARVRNAAQTRDDILRAARARFGSDGYDRTTIRTVAADVGVDPALVIRYFGSKQDLFAAAAEFTLNLPDLSGVNPGRRRRCVAAELLRGLGGGQHLRRAAPRRDDEPDRRRDDEKVFASQVAPTLAAITPDHPAERAGLMGAFVIGLATTRYVLANPAIAELSHDELIQWARPVIHQLLVGPAPL